MIGSLLPKLKPWLFAIFLGSTIGLSASYLFIFSVQWNSQIVVAGASAFFGAFFAFSLSKAGDFLKRIGDRAHKHHTALVLLEYEFGNHLSVLGDNLATTRSML